MPKILAFAASTRTGSVNARLLHAVIPLVETAGGEVTAIDLREFEMPLYNGDLEAEKGLPEAARRLKALMIAHDGLLIASPEYNGSFTPLLKNSIDWCSRHEDGDPGPLAAYKGKVAAIISAAPGRLGGLRGLLHLRQLLSNIGLHVIPDQVAVAHAQQALGEDGAIIDEQYRGNLTGLAGALVNVSSRLADG